MAPEKPIRGAISLSRFRCGVSLEILRVRLPRIRTAWRDKAPAAYCVPATNRNKGPKEYAPVAPAKYRPGSDDSNPLFRSG
jgi:hypothetical protein